MSYKLNPSQRAQVFDKVYLAAIQGAAGSNRSAVEIHNCAVELVQLAIAEAEKMANEAAEEG